MAFIFVVDDERNIRMMIRKSLQQAGHRVEEAEDGIQALERMAGFGHVDLALLDQRMPGLSGLDVMREMLRRDPRARAVMMTAFGTIELLAEAIRGGAKDFLRKPFTLETLRGCVSAVLADLPAYRAPLPTEPAVVRFSFVTMNGFWIDALREPIRHHGGGIHQMMAIRSPNGNVTPCDVVLSPILVARIAEDSGVDPGAEAVFWQGACEEALANYLWQEAQVPFGGVLRVDTYTTSLRRWVIAATAAQFNAITRGEPAGIGSPAGLEVEKRRM